jgi:hypothetical protein
LSFPARVTIALALSTLLLGGCATSPIDAGQGHASSAIASGLPAWAGGEPANAPARPAAQPAYPLVNAPVAPREAKALTDEEQAKAVADLVAARTRTQARAEAARKDEDIASDEGLALARGKYAGEPKPSSN